MKREPTNAGNSNDLRRLEPYFSAIANQYNFVVLFHFAEDAVEILYRDGKVAAEKDYAQGIDVNRTEFGKEWIYPADLEGYMRFSDVRDIFDRLEASKNGYLSGMFRVRLPGTSRYEWRMITAMNVSQGEEPLLLGMVCDFAPSTGTGKFAKQRMAEPQKENREVISSYKAMWRGLMERTQMKYFWKDTNRRFLGASKAFLDFYNLDSVDYILGKTDEELAWNLNSSDAQSAEENVLINGETMMDIPITALINGRVCKIFATKIPLYENGKIVGLIGYFIDEDQLDIRVSRMESSMAKDELTKFMSASGTLEALWRFHEEKLRYDEDYALIHLSVPNYDQWVEEQGKIKGDALIRKVTEILKVQCGAETAIGRIYGCDFVLLGKFMTQERANALTSAIRQEVHQIKEVDGEPISLEAKMFCAMGNPEDSPEDLLEFLLSVYEKHQI